MDRGEIDGKYYLFLDDHNKEDKIKVYTYAEVRDKEAFKQMRMNEKHPYSTHRLELAAPSEWAGEID